MNERIKKNTINKVSVLLLWAIHIGKTIFMFRGVRWKDELPIVNVDYIIYYARALRAHEFYEKSGRFWGYDPYEMAGYVSGPIHEAGNYLMSWVSHVLSGVIPIHRTLLILEIMGLFLVPVMMYGAVKVWRENEEEAWAAFGVTVLMFGWFDPFSSQMIWASLFTFQVGTALSFLAVSLMWRAVRQGGYRWWLALGGKTYKLKFGHRGANHPVKDLTTGKVEITTQNHGFVVDIDSLAQGDVEGTHINLNDGTLEGLRHKHLPLFSVQYHPEAAPGPHDSHYLFKRFFDLMKAKVPA
jgi:hypothetical protein